jgi:glutamate-ammonia-ligase adenylyltransferase
MADAFARRITRLPLAVDATAGDETAALLGVAEVAPLVAGAAGSSPYLKGLIASEADWLRAAVMLSPEAALQSVLTALAPAAPEVLGPALRQAKRRVALLAGLADLGGVWALEEVTGALTGLADRAVELAVEAFVAEEVRRGKLAETGAPAQGMVVLAMGKLGAGELNYSSDIDLICLHDETRHAGRETEARAAFVRVTRKMAALLSDMTGDGYVFRTDLRLRPDAAVTPVCLSIAAAEAYYEAEGRTWERAA